MKGILKKFVRGTHATPACGGALCVPHLSGLHYFSSPCYANNSQTKKQILSSSIDMFISMHANKVIAAIFFIFSVHLAVTLCLEFV